MAEAYSLFPEIRIRSSWLLTERLAPHVPQTPSKSQLRLAAVHDQVDGVVERYRQTWEQQEGQIVQGICHLLNLRFRQNVIDAYVVPGVQVISDPIIIGPAYDPDYFPDILTHELLHTLLTDNMTYKNDPTLLERWKDMFGRKHSFQTLVHIPVHAGLHAVYTDILDEPYRLQRDMIYGETQPGYTKAWDYVEEHGHQHILGQLAATHQMLTRAQVESQ